MSSFFNSIILCLLLFLSLTISVHANDTSSINSPVFGHQIKIGRKYCQGTVIKLDTLPNNPIAPPKLALITAAHCLVDTLLHPYYSIVNFTNSSNAHTSMNQYRKIRKIIWSTESIAESLKNLDFENIPSVSTWCKNYHQDDMVVVLFNSIVNDPLNAKSIGINRLLLDLDTATENNQALQQSSTHMAYFKDQRILLNANVSFRTVPHTDNAAQSTNSNQVEIMKRNSGMPYFMDNKIAGVASCYVSESETTDQQIKMNYFSRWNKKLIDILKKESAQ